MESNSRKPEPAVACTGWFGITVTIDLDMRPLVRDGMVVPVECGRSEFSAALQVLKNAEHEVLIKQTAVCLGYIPKAIVEALKVGDVLTTQWREIDMEQALAPGDGVNLKHLPDPARGTQTTEDALLLVPIQWTVKTHRTIMPNARTERCGRHRALGLGDDVARPHSLQ